MNPLLFGTLTVMADSDLVFSHPRMRQLPAKAMSRKPRMVMRSSAVVSQAKHRISILALSNLDTPSQPIVPDEPAPSFKESPTESTIDNMLSGCAKCCMIAWIVCMLQLHMQQNHQRPMYLVAVLVSMSSRVCTTGGPYSAHRCQAQNSTAMHVSTFARSSRMCTSIT